MPAEDDTRERGPGGLWRLARIEENQRDIKHLLEVILAQSNGIIQRGEERGWKIDAIMADIQRSIREMREAVEKRGTLDNPAIVKILVLGLLAATGANIGVKALIGG